MSKIEDKFEQIFKSAGVKYIREKTFPELKGGILRYDFYLPDLGILIEIDSMLHFKMIPKFHKSKAEFTHAQQNDRLKNSFALSHKIKLYRVPEWDFQNTTTLSDILQSHHLVQSKWHNDIIYREYLKRQMS